MGEIWVFLSWSKNLLGYLVLKTTEDLLDPRRRVKKLQMILWECRVFLFVWVMEQAV